MVCGGGLSTSSRHFLQSEGMPPRKSARTLVALPHHDDVYVAEDMPVEQRDLLCRLLPELTTEAVERIFGFFPRRGTGSIRPEDLTFRRLHWLLTTYGARHKVTLVLPDGGSESLYELHAQELFRRQGKVFFDVFNRTSPVSLRFCSPFVETSTAQLALLLWADKLDILRLAQGLARELYEDSRRHRMWKGLGKRRASSPAEPVQTIVRNKRIRLML